MTRLNPTLWRTCRVLANSRRLQMLRLIHENHELCVADIAMRTNTSPPNTSIQLRNLHARGLLCAQRKRNRLFYTLEANENIPFAAPLVSALAAMFDQNKSNQSIVHVCTGFTHPRRIEIVQYLERQPMSFKPLLDKTGISPAALNRHLNKLIRRHIVQKKGKHFHLKTNNNPLLCALHDTVKTEV